MEKLTQLNTLLSGIETKGESTVLMANAMFLLQHIMRACQQPTGEVSHDKL